MSLINEALKRAQEDKQRQESIPSSCTESGAASFSRDTQPPQGAKGSVSQVGDYDVSCKVTTVAVIETPPAEELAAPHSSRAIFGFSAGVLVMVVLCLVMLWLREQRVREVSASDMPQAQPAEVAELPTGSAELALGLIEQQLDGVDSASSDQHSATATPVPVLPNAQPAATAVPISVSPPAAVQSAAVPSLATQLALPVQPVAAQATQPDDVTSRFSLGGIMSVDEEWMATINGKLLRVGETIDGGTLIRIMSQAVEMESAGQRFTLRM